MAIRVAHPSASQARLEDRLKVWLVRAGFGTGVAISVLKKWEVDDEVLTALQEERTRRIKMGKAVPSPLWF